MAFSFLVRAAAGCLLLAGTALAQVPNAPGGAGLGDLAFGVSTQRYWATPTAAPDKGCATGRVPVTLPLAAPLLASPFVPFGELSKLAPNVTSYVYGELCMSGAARQAAAAGKPPAVLVLTPGYTYNGYYWDFPYRPELYSTVTALVAAGYATFNYDRVGTGRSAHPPSAMTTVGNHANVLSQLIRQLRGNGIFGTRFNAVGSVGHSFGSITAYVEASQFNDADAVILTGFGHRVAADAGGPALNSGPALLDARTAREPWAKDLGYLMPRSGTRDTRIFYAAGNFEAAMVAVDEQLADTITAFEITNLIPSMLVDSGKALRIPTFTINGEKDAIFCGNGMKACATTGTASDSPAQLEAKAGTFVAYDGPAFPPQACFRAAIVPGSAHNLSLHLNAPQFVRQLLYFADQAIGRNGENVNAYKAGCMKRAPTLVDQLPELTRLLPPVTQSGVGN